MMLSKTRLKLMRLLANDDKKYLLIKRETLGERIRDKKRTLNRVSMKQNNVPENYVQIRKITDELNADIRRYYGQLDDTDREIMNVNSNIKILNHYICNHSSSISIREIKSELCY